MRYSKDLRTRVLDHVRSGGSKTEAAKIYGISRRTIYNWERLGSEHLKPGPQKGFKICIYSLQDFIQKHPDKLLKELASHFGVTESGICKALKRAKITRKKNVVLHSEVSPKTKDISEEMVQA